MTSTRRIICICSGNICRSPMAVALLRPKLAARDISAVVISAGTLGIHGRRAAAFARRAIAEVDENMGQSIAEHRSQGVSSGLVQMADHLVVMAPRHEHHLQKMAPELGTRVVRLWEYAARDDHLDKIPDPVGHDLDVFRGCRDLIDDGLEHWLDDQFGDDRDCTGHD